MLAFVPVVFDAYRTVRPALRWTLQNLVAFTNSAGRCFPSVRKLAAVAGISKSTASRHLADLARDGILTRQRRPGGCYAYTIATRFLPTARGGVPPARKGCSHRWEEKNRQVRKQRRASALDSQNLD